ncbi:MAG: hypothetical protein WAU11_11000 [Ignavibacteriaceae bacterium]
MAQDKNKTDFDSALFTGNKYDDKETNLLFEQYKLYLELVDRISDRRQNANSYFLGINTALCAVIGYLFSKDIDSEVKPLIWFVPFAGIILSYFWYRLVKSYRDLNTAKFQVVHSIESKLPLAPYHAEWIALGEGNDSKKYTPFTHLEIWVPRCFILLYLIILFYLIPWAKLLCVFKSP